MPENVSLYNRPLFFLRLAAALCPACLSRWRLPRTFRTLLCLLVLSGLFFGAYGQALAAAAPFKLPPSRAQAEAMLGQMLLLGFRGTGTPEAAGQDQSYQAMLEFIRAGKAGGVVLFYTDYSSKQPGRNISSPEQLKNLTAALQNAAAQAPLAQAGKGEILPLFIGVDQEGGRVRRLFPEQGFMDLPAPSSMGLMQETAVYSYGLRLGQELRGLGVNLNFAPGLDLNINPRNPAIGALGRSFGRGAEQVARQAGAFGRGLTEAGVAACFKHFPGHGSSSSDTHRELTDVTASWRPEELDPYRVLLNNRVFPKDRTHMVMPGHIFNAALDERYPASLSPATINGLLRAQLGWQGVVISDDLQMKAISDHYSLEETILLSLEAGTDILLFGNNLEYDPDLPEKAWQTLRKLLHERKISPERVAESYQRITRLKAWLAKGEF